jgi:hypothetical protein
MSLEAEKILKEDTYSVQSTLATTEFLKKTKEEILHYLVNKINEKLKDDVLLKEYQKMDKRILNNKMLRELILFSPENVTNDNDIIENKENGMIINVTQSILHMPCRNVFKDIIGWSIIDSYRYDTVKNYSCHISFDKNSDPYPSISGVNQKLHSFIYGKVTQKGMLIDHRNGHTFDARDNNLEEINASQSSHNKKKKENASSKYKGVFFNKDHQKYQVIIVNEGKRMTLGTYQNQLDAAIMRDVWCVHIFKEYANLNTDDNGKNLLSNEIIEDILKNGIPEKYKLPEKKEKELPRCIRKAESGRYFFYKEIKKNGKKKFYCGTRRDTVEEAVKDRDEYESQLEMKTEKIKEEKLEKILRTKKGVPYIPVIFRKKIYKFLVNASVWRDLMQYKWRGIANAEYAQTEIDGKTIKMHNYIFTKHMGGILKNDETVDHIICGRKRDNRFSNLRPLSKSGQSHNTEHLRYINLPRGVQLSQQQFKVMHDRKNYGSFKTVEEAAQKYNEIVINKYGENAKLNIITTMGTNYEKYLDSIKHLFTPLYISQIETVEELKILLRIFYHWREKYQILIKDIKKDKVRELRLKLSDIAVIELGFDDRNDLNSSNNKEKIKYKEQEGYEDLLSCDEEDIRSEQEERDGGENEEYENDDGNDDEKEEQDVLSQEEYDDSDEAIKNKSISEIHELIKKSTKKIQTVTEVFEPIAIKEIPKPLKLNIMN